MDTEVAAVHGIFFIGEKGAHKKSSVITVVGLMMCSWRLWFEFFFRITFSWALCPLSCGSLRGSCVGFCEFFYAVCGSCSWLRAPEIFGVSDVLVLSGGGCWHCGGGVLEEAQPLTQHHLRDWQESCEHLFGSECEYRSYICWGINETRCQASATKPTPTGACSSPLAELSTLVTDETPDRAERFIIQELSHPLLFMDAITLQ